MADFLNKKTLLIGGAVLVGGLIIVTVAGGKKSSPTINAVQSGPSPAQMQLALASMQANARISEANISAGIQNRQIDAQLAVATLSAGLEKYKTDAAASNAAAQLTVQAKQDEYSANLARYNIDAQLASQASAQNYQLDYAETAAQTTMGIAAINANMTNNILMAQNAKEIARLNTVQNIQLASINAGVRATELAAADNANRLSFLNNNLPLLNKRNRDDILWLVAGGDTSHKTVQSDLSGIAQVIGSAGNIIGSFAGIF